MKTKITKNIEHTIWNKTHEGVSHAFGCFEVTLGQTLFQKKKEIVDYVTFHKGTVRCYEIKTSISDLKSKNKISDFGHFNYLVLTDEVYEYFKNSDLVHDYYNFGIYVWSNNELILMKKPSRHQITMGEITTVMESMIRSMDREINKIYKKNGGY